MTITDPNGNTLKIGKPAINWCGKHLRHAIRKETDSVGRVTLTFICGKAAKFFPADLHPKMAAAISRLQF
jgi:hypothetical protein